MILIRMFKAVKLFQTLMTVYGILAFPSFRHQRPFLLEEKCLFTRVHEEANHELREYKCKLFIAIKLQLFEDISHLAGLASGMGYNWGLIN